MKNQFTYNVHQPCSRNWDTFTPLAAGRFCHSCNHEVIDFTGMSEQEVIHYFRNMSEGTCGRFRKEQLPTAPVSRASFRPSWLAAAVLGLFVVIGTGDLTAQQISEPEHAHVMAEMTPGGVMSLRVVEGIVKDEDGEVIIGANVFLKDDPTVGTVTDIDGKFTFPRELSSGDVLVISFLGFEPVEYKIRGTEEDPLEIELTMVYMIMGKVASDDLYESPSFFSKVWSKVKGAF